MTENKSKLKITPNNLMVLEQNYYQAAFHNEDGCLSRSFHLPLEVWVYQNRFYLSDGHHRLNERHEADMSPICLNLNYQRTKPLAGNDKFVPLTQIYRNYYQSEPPPLKWLEYISLPDQLEAKRGKINRSYWQAGFRLGSEIEPIIKEMAVFAPQVFIYNRPKLPVFVWELADKYLYAFSFFQALLIKEVWKDKKNKSENLLCYHGNYEVGAVKKVLQREEIFEVQDLCKGQQRFYSLPEKF